MVASRPEMRRGRALVPPRTKRASRSALVSGVMECRDPRAFAMLCAAMFFIYSDQNLMAPNLTAIGEFFGYDDDERDAKLGGQISVAFFLLGFPAALIIGVMCDVIERKRVLVWTLVLGQGPCLLTLFVTEYWQLFILRTLTGVAVGGALPLVYSITGDLFPPSSRSYASATVGICSSLGGMCGQGVAGFLGPAYGWRLPFAVVAAPGLLVAYLVHAFAVEPARGAADRLVRRFEPHVQVRPRRFGDTPPGTRRRGRACRRRCRRSRGVFGATRSESWRDPPTGWDFCRVFPGACLGASSACS